MEEYKNLEEIIKLCIDDLDKDDNNVTAILDLTDLKELRHLLARVKQLEALKQSCPAMPTTGVECEFKNKVEELEKENKNYKKYAVMMSTEGLIINGVKFSFNDYIPKSKVIEKIEEIKMTSSQINGDYFMNNYKIDVLQELLEE